MKSSSHYLLVGALVLASPVTAMAETPQAPAQKGPADVRTQGEIRGYIWPIAAGIEGARASTVALQSLSTNEPFNRKDARKAAEIADKSLTVAYDTAEELSKMKGLTLDAKAQAQNAVMKLKAARGTLSQIRDQVGVIEGLFERVDAEKVHNLSTTLITQIHEAQKATQSVADVYQISVSNEFWGK